MTRTITVSPRPAYWSLYFIVMPMVGFVLFAVVGGAIAALLGNQLTGKAVITGWILTTIAVTLFSLRRDLQRSCLSYEGTTLTIGRGAWSTRIPHDDIESVIVGLPDELPVWFRLLGLHPSFRQIEQLREKSLVFRIRGGKLIALAANIANPRNGDLLLQRLVHDNSHRLEPVGSYTDDEIKTLKSPSWNRLFFLE